MFVSASCRTSISRFRPLTSDCPRSGGSRLSFGEKLLQWSTADLLWKFINPTKESEI
jgi:hypothetical protein